MCIRDRNYIRDTKRHAWEELEPTTEFDPEFAGHQADAIQSMEAAELKIALDAAIEALPEKCRMVFQLNRQEEMSYAEVAKHLGISVKTVENQIGKALKLLRMAIAGHGG